MEHVQHRDFRVVQETEGRLHDPAHVPDEGGVHALSECSAHDALIVDDRL